MVGDKSFHSPIDGYTKEAYPNLPEIEIEGLKTYGHEIEDLVSVQFVTKVVNLIESGNFKYVSTAVCAA